MRAVVISTQIRRMAENKRRRWIYLVEFDEGEGEEARLIKLIKKRTKRKRKRKGIGRGGGEGVRRSGG